MRSISEKFTEKEFAKLLKSKAESGLNWHDFIMKLTEPKENDSNVDN